MPRKSSSRRASASRPTDSTSRKRPGSQAATGEAAIAPAVSDRIEADAVDPRWVRVRWTLGESTVRRAAAVLGAGWHHATPALRLLRLSGPVSSRSIAVGQPCAVPPDARQWFVEVAEPGTCVQVQLGFLDAGRIAADGADRSGDASFYAVLSSPPTTTPQTGPDLPAESAALPDEILAELRCVTGDEPTIDFELRPQLRLLGRSDPRSRLAADDEPIDVADDGTFELTRPLDSGRQIVSVDLTPQDGRPPQRTLVALELSVRTLDQE